LFIFEINECKEDHSVWSCFYNPLLYTHEHVYTCIPTQTIIIYVYIYISIYIHIWIYHTRWMSYETGDFTWENEYQGGCQTWPVTEQMQEGDNFNNLYRISAPMLLLHGMDDPICPLSQSRVAYNVLTMHKVPTQLVAYPGEGHGFSQPANRRDRDRRMLAWFLEHLPVNEGAKARVFMSQ